MHMIINSDSFAVIQIQFQQLQSHHVENILHLGQVTHMDYKAAIHVYTLSDHELYATFTLQVTYNFWHKFFRY